MNNKKNIYAIACSHLDTTWLWDLETTIKEYIPATLKDNFKLFEQFPEYRFGFEGSYRYELMEEYYPDLFNKLCEYINNGNWVPTGSAYENGDVNQPSPEALFRNILYGNDYFEKKFGKPSNDIFLPDCFGFGYALPSIMKHAGLKGFTTGKLEWGSAVGIPFDLGKWYGVDGNYVYANTNPGQYTCNIHKLRTNKKVLKKLNSNINKYNLPITTKFYGIGDRGGAPAADSVKNVCEEKKINNQSDINIDTIASVDLFEIMDKELTAEQKEKLPVWNGELLMTDHGCGSYTSRAVGSRWNKNCERLADIAESNCVIADYVSGHKYPQEVIDTAWKRTIAHQFHDDITGTSFQKCYKRNWNDYMLSQKQFAQEYIAASKSIADIMDTSFTKGKAVIVNNPTQFERTEAVSINLQIDGAVRVFDNQGKEVPSQNYGGKITFIASLAPYSSRVYDVQKANNAFDNDTGLYINKNKLGNKYIEVVLDDNGDICQITDKKLNQNILSGKIALVLFDYKGSKSWPAWELHYKEVIAPAREYAKRPEFEIIEDAKARVSLKLTRYAGKSKFIQVLSLDAESKVLKVFNEVDWRDTAALLKVEFPVSCANPKATYDLGLGYIQRGNDTAKMYEVPAQLWVDITAADNSYGVSIFSDSRTGWDKPNDSTLRLTVVHTPKYSYRWEASQHLMDLGLNRFSFGVYCHEGALGSATQTQAQCFNQPMHCFATDSHEGKASEYSFAKLSDNSVLIRAMKKAQNSDEIIVRFNEGEGKEKQNVEFEIGQGIESAYEVLANEKYINDALLIDGKLMFNIGAFEPKTFALKLKKNEIPKEENQKQIELPLNKKLITSNENACEIKLSIPQEIIPSSINCGGIDFAVSKGAYNAVECKKQIIDLPKDCNKVYILACSLNGDKTAEFGDGVNTYNLQISDWQQAVGAWDLIGLQETGFIKKDTLAYNSTHAHSKEGDIAAKQLYLFRYELNINSDKLILPDDKDICVFAITTAQEHEFSAGNEYYDLLQKRKFDYDLSKRDIKKSQPSLLERIMDKHYDRYAHYLKTKGPSTSKHQIADIYAEIRAFFERLS